MVMWRRRTWNFDAWVAAGGDLADEAAFAASPPAGQRAPDFTLPRLGGGAPVTPSRALSSQPADRGVRLVHLTALLGGGSCARRGGWQASRGQVGVHLHAGGAPGRERAAPRRRRGQAGQRPAAPRRGRDRPGHPGGRAVGHRAPRLRDDAEHDLVIDRGGNVIYKANWTSAANVAAFLARFMAAREIHPPGTTAVTFEIQQPNSATATAPGSPSTCGAT